MAAKLNFDEVQLWNCVNLKAYCRKKGLICSGRKEELVARVFAASEMGLPDILSADEERKEKAVSYASLLNTSHGRQPDPFCELETGWVEEDLGRKLWPSTMYCDITAYFHSLTGDINTSVTKRALNMYKEGKAFSYFDSGWLKEVFYHPISPQSPYCYLKAQCTPSQRIGNVPHSTWIMVEKQSGEIQTAYCTCFAGLGSTCNHVAAILFKMDFYWRQGLTNKACTDRECSWNKYGADRTAIAPAKVEDLCFRKPKFGKNVEPKKQKSTVHSISPFSFQELTAALIDSCPDAVVFESERTLSPDDVFDVEITTSGCPTLFEIFSKCCTREEIATELAKFTNADIKDIEKCTRGQSGNDLWRSHRIHRVTASIAHDVSTRMKTLSNASSKRSKDPIPILNVINKVDQKNFKKVPQLKYGVEMESEARTQYTKLTKTQHRSLTVSEVGLVVNKEFPQYGASPDGVVSCVCCETGLLEIKCPLSISHSSPTAENLPYLVKVGSATSLSPTSKYYSQIQWQMGICNKPWCDFFVYTRHGYHLERVPFNSKCFDSMLTNVNTFYSEYVVPAILKENQLRSPLVCDTETAIPLSSAVGTASETQTPINENNCFILSKAQTDCSKAPKRRKIGKQVSEPVYICGTCSKVCTSPENMQDESDNCVQCDNCFQWFHFNCVAYFPTDDTENEWLCPSCMGQFTNNNML